MLNNEKCIKCEHKQCGIKGDLSKSTRCRLEIEESIKKKLNSLKGEFDTRVYKNLNLDERDRIEKLIIKSLMNDKSFASSMNEIESDIRTWNKFIENYLCLEHEYDTTRGLWCSDRPDVIPKEQKNNFFQLK